MRVRYLMITAFIATAFAACAGAETKFDTETTFGTVCEARCTCEVCSADETKQCIDEQEAVTAQAEKKNCADEKEAYSDCVRQQGRCVNRHYLAQRCNVQAAALAGCLDPTKNCPTAGDGICDEPGGTGSCASGTDPADCLAPCPLTGNGICDEPGGTGNCPAGTDVDDCKLPPCDFVNNGQCDEPEGTGNCAEGTDVDDCRVLTCATVNNGQCDEPEGTGLCSEGTDVADCGAPACELVNNGRCDEPEGTGLCPEGTDVADCGAQGCDFVNNGRCDEPEGTGLCPEGTDVTDCGVPTTCDSIGACGDSSSGCQACARRGACLGQANACNGNASCINLSACLESCFDQPCIDECKTSYPGGVALFNAVTACVICDECYVSCDGFGAGC